MGKIVFLLLVLINSVYANMVYLSPGSAVGKDSYAEESAPDDNYGDAEQIFCGYAEGFLSWSAFIKFEELNDSQYQGATVVDAILRLWVYRVSFNLQPALLSGRNLQ